MGTIERCSRRTFAQPSRMLPARSRQCQTVRGSARYLEGLPTFAPQSECGIDHSQGCLPQTVLRKLLLLDPPRIANVSGGAQNSRFKVAKKIHQDIMKAYALAMIARDSIKDFDDSLGPDAQTSFFSNLPPNGGSQ